MKQKVLSFSGGQTSGYMLWREIQKLGIEEYNRQFITCFENTGREHNATLDFVHEVETRWGVPVVWLEYTRIPAVEIDAKLVPDGQKRTNLLKQQQQGIHTHWFRKVNHKTARRIGDYGPFDELLSWVGALPNVRSRSCSGYLKVRTGNRYLESIGIREFTGYIGIRADEAHRAVEIRAAMENYRSAEFPLIDDGVTKGDVDHFWNEQPFRLQIPNHMGNCDLCFLKAKWKRREIAMAYPRQAQWWADKEAEFGAKIHGPGAFFRANDTYQGLINSLDQLEMEMPDAEDEDIPCSCAVGAYRSLPDDDEI